MAQLPLSTSMETNSPWWSDSTRALMSRSYIFLPRRAVSSLALRWRSGSSRASFALLSDSALLHLTVYCCAAVLANDDVVTFDVHDVTVHWDGQPRHIKADATGSTPLVGMLLLDRHNLNIEVERGSGPSFRSHHWATICVVAVLGKSGPTHQRQASSP